ncbi:MAG TPA: hypothetical protein ENK21_01710 [Trueperaceae bacterium]|nr:hypothetical protein [Trueperaceae bacterium]
MERQTNFNIKSMISQSKQILLSPSIEKFEEFENSGGVLAALLYVAIANIIASIISFTFINIRLGISITDMISELSDIFTIATSFVIPLIQLTVGALVLFVIAKFQNTSGSFKQIAYSLSLFWAPLTVIFSIVESVTLLLTLRTGLLNGLVSLNIVGLLELIPYFYFSFLAYEASLNKNGRSIVWLSLIIAGFIIEILAKIIDTLISKII